MSDLNNWNGSGRLTADPELRHTPQGTPVVDINLANETGFGEKKRTNFPGLTFWGKQAESLAQYAQKGQYLIIEGELSQESWEDKETGKNRSKTKVTVRRWHFTPGGKPRTHEEGSPAQHSSAPGTSVDALPDGDDDEIPF